MIDNLKIVFMGTPEFAANSLRKLVESGYNVIGCFTKPDKQSGRGMKFKYSEVKEYALNNNIPVYQPQKVKNNTEVLDILNELSPDVIVVVAYGKILPKEILELPKYGCINVHGSLLPNHRGSAPIQWSIINGDKITGITTMFMDVGMDTGDMLLKEETQILDEDNFETLHDKLKEIGANLLIKTLEELKAGKLNRIKQPEEGTIAPMINKDMTKIDFNKDSREIFNFIRGLSPFPGTYMEQNNGLKYKVYKSKIVTEKELENIVIDENTVSGQVVYISKSNLYIKCSDGFIGILEIQPENGKRMDISAFIAGNKLKVGDMFV